MTSLTTSCNTTGCVLDSWSVSARRRVQPPTGLTEMYLGRLHRLNGQLLYRPGRGDSYGV